MKKRLSFLVTMLALVAGTLVQAETAQAACDWGPIPPSTNGTGVITSQLYPGGLLRVYGQNQGSWGNGGYTHAYFWRNDTYQGLPGVHGGLYTTQLRSNGTYSSIPRYFSNLAYNSSYAVYPDPGHTKIAAIQVQIWYCW